MDKPLALLHYLADGLTGYMAFESRCGMSQAYSEYLLYGPIVRIANHLGWQVQSEWPHAKTSQAKGTRGDYERIDFLFKRTDKNAHVDWVAIEVKWAPSAVKPLDCRKDIKKLREAVERFPEKHIEAYLLVVGAHGIPKHGVPALKASIKGLTDQHAPLFSTAYAAATSRRYGVTVYKID